MRLRIKEKRAELSGTIKQTQGRLKTEPFPQSVEAMRRIAQVGCRSTPHCFDFPRGKDLSVAIPDTDPGLDVARERPANPTSDYYKPDSYVGFVITY
jgi:hypothetical protein